MACDTLQSSCSAAGGEGTIEMKCSAAAMGAVSKARVGRDTEAPDAGPNLREPTASDSKREQRKVGSEDRCDLSTGAGALGGGGVGRVSKDLEGLDWSQVRSAKFTRGSSGTKLRGPEYGAVQSWKGTGPECPGTGVSCCEQSGLRLPPVTHFVEEG